VRICQLLPLICETAEKSKRRQKTNGDDHPMAACRRNSAVTDGDKKQTATIIPWRFTAGSAQ